MTPDRTVPSSAPAPAAEDAPLTPAGLRDLIEQSLEDDKAADIVAIDLAGKTAIADHMMIASGTSSRHVAAMAGHIRDKASAAGVKGIRMEGLNQADWVLIDLGDVIVHLFRPEVRAFYKIEEMWDRDTPVPLAERMPHGH